MTTPDYILAKALAELLVSIDLTDDDDLDPDTAMKLLEPVAALLENSSTETQHHIAELLYRCAEEETNPDRRLTALDLPNALGLA